MKYSTYLARGIVITVLALLQPEFGRADTAESAANIGFENMEIYRFERGTALLQIYDLNNDGLHDIIFANNTASRLEVLIRTQSAPPPESGRVPRLEDVFVNQGVVVDQQIMACTIADIYGPGQPAILTLGRELGLHLHRYADGALLPAQGIYLKNIDRLMDCRTADLNGNGYPDIVIGRKDNVEILWNDGAGQFHKRTELNITPPDALKIELADFTGNGHVDLLVFMATESTLPRLYPGVGAGKFGPECILVVAPARRSAALHLNNVSLPVPGAELLTRDKQTAYLASIAQSGRGLRLYDIQAHPVGDIFSRDEIMPRRIILRGLGPRHTPVWLTHDFNKNGYDDFGVAAPELGQFHIYPGTATGLAAEPEIYDSLAGINSVSLTVNGDLLVFSALEKTAALHERERLDAFPRLLLPPEPPLIAAAHPLYPGLIWICRDPANRSAVLIEESLGDETDKHIYPLELPNDPDSIMAFKLDNQTAGIMLFIPFQPPVFYALTRGNDLTVVDQTAFNPAALSLRPAMVYRRAGAEMLLALGKVARAFQWRDNTLQPTRQFSPGMPNAVISAITGFQRAAGNGVLLHEQDSNNLLWFGDMAENQSSAQPHVLHIGLPLAQPAGLCALRGPDGAHDSGLLLVTAQEVFIFHNNEEALHAVAVAEYTSVGEDPSLGDFRRVEQGSPPRPMIAVTDPRNRALELVELQDDQLSVKLAFEVFQDPGFTGARGRTGLEPREVASGDINGNGIGDLVLLVHDKLIIYLGEDGVSVER